MANNTCPKRPVLVKEWSQEKETRTNLHTSIQYFGPAHFMEIFSDRNFFPLK